jgi:DNA polymerase-4
VSLHFASKWPTHRDEPEFVTAELLRALYPLKKAVRLLGVSVSGFVGEEAVAPAQTALEQ